MCVAAALIVSVFLIRIIVFWFLFLHESCFQHWTTLQHAVRQLAKSNLKKRSKSGKVTSCDLLVQNPPCMARHSQFGHYLSTLQCGSCCVFVSQWMQTCTAVRLGFKTTDTSRGCTCDDAGLLPLLFSADLRTTSPLQAHTPHTSTWHLICSIPAVFGVLESKRDEKSRRGWQRQNVIALMKMLQNIKPNLLQLTAFRDVITVPVLVEVHSTCTCVIISPHPLWKQASATLSLPLLHLDPCWHPVSAW